MDLDAIVRRIHDEVQPHTQAGRVADYIPALARVSANHLGIAVVTVDGRVAIAGDAQAPFSIQSISKVFSLTLALGRIGTRLWSRVGREPSGSAFNSIVQLEHESGIPRNPFINAGAIVVSDVLLEGRGESQTISELLGLVRTLSDDAEVHIDQEVAQSEAQTGFRNRSLAHFMRAFANLHNPVEGTLGVYFNQCAMAMSCVQLARAGLFLACDGRDPLLQTQIVRPDRARRVNAIMLTCGHYDASGDFAFRVGLPGKSGVGGGILAVAPGQAAIAVWSPGLSAAGSSLAGTLMLERLVALTGWSVFAACSPIE